MTGKDYAKIPRLHKAERKWPRSAEHPDALKAVQEDFLQVRLCGFEQGSPRFPKCGGILSAHVELGELSLHLNPPTLVPLLGYGARLGGGFAQMGRQFLSEVNPTDEWNDTLPEIARWGDLPDKGPLELRLRAYSIDVHLHEHVPKSLPPYFVTSEEDGIHAADETAVAGALCSARLQHIEVHLNAGDDTPKVGTTLAANLLFLAVVGREKRGDDEKILVSLLEDESSSDSRGGMRAESPPATPVADAAASAKAEGMPIDEPPPPPPQRHSVATVATAPSPLSKGAGGSAVSASSRSLLSLDSILESERELSTRQSTSSPSARRSGREQNGRAESVSSTASRADEQVDEWAQRMDERSRAGSDSEYLPNVSACPSHCRRCSHLVSAHLSNHRSCSLRPCPLPFHPHSHLASHAPLTPPLIAPPAAPQNSPSLHPSALTRLVLRVTARRLRGRRE